MNQGKELALITGAHLIINSNSLLCYDEKHSEIELTRGQELLLKRLANHVNCAVSMSELYEAYSGDTILLGDTGIRDNIAKMKNTLPACIKGSIKSVRGYGYKLITAQSSAPTISEQQAVEVSHLTGLTGDYYGFFLDPVGNGSILGAYFHIEKSDNSEQHLAVSAILGIRDTAILLDDDLSEVFSPTTINYHQKFKEFISNHSINNKRCFWAEGNLHCHNTVAEISLKTPIEAKWNIWFDLGSFLERTKHESIYNYKGGMGFTVAVTPSYGTFCCKVGLVRTSYFTQPQKIHAPELQNMLSLSSINEFDPLMLDIHKDRYWYNWFMSE